VLDIPNKRFLLVTINIPSYHLKIKSLDLKRLISFWRYMNI
jgi:hypothetical protein